MYTSTNFLNLRSKGPRKGALGGRRTTGPRKTGTRELGPETPCFIPAKVAEAIAAFHKLYFGKNTNGENIDEGDFMFPVNRLVNGTYQVFYMYAHKLIKTLLSYVMSQEGYFTTLEVNDEGSVVMDHKGGRLEQKTTKVKLFNIAQHTLVEMGGERGMVLHQLAVALEMLLITGRNAVTNEPMFKIASADAPEGRLAPDLRTLTKKQVLDHLLPNNAVMSAERNAWIKFYTEEKIRVDYYKQVNGQNNTSFKSLDKLSDQEKILQGERSILMHQSIQAVIGETKATYVPSLSMGIGLREATSLLQSLKPAKSTGASAASSAAKREVAQYIDEYNSLTGQNIKEKEIGPSQYSHIKEDVEYARSVRSIASSQGRPLPRFTIGSNGRLVELKTESSPYEMQQHYPQIGYNPYMPYQQYPQIGYGMPPQYPQIGYGMPYGGHQQMPPMPYGGQQQMPQQMAPPNYGGNFAAQIAQSNAGGYPSQPPANYAPASRMSNPNNAVPLVDPKAVLTSQFKSPSPNTGPVAGAAPATIASRLSVAGFAKVGQSSIGKPVGSASSPPVNPALSGKTNQAIVSRLGTVLQGAVAQPAASSSSSSSSSQNPAPEVKEEILRQIVQENIEEGASQVQESDEPTLNTVNADAFNQALQESEHEGKSAVDQDEESDEEDN